MKRHSPHHSAYQLGATLVEFVVITPLLLFMLGAIVQYGLLYHTKSQVNYATFEAARAGTVSNADPAKIRTAFTRAMTGYYGGGTTTAQLAASYAKAVADTTAVNVRIEILSPTKESFDDYASPALAKKLNTSSRVIPNSSLAHIKCPIDVPGCNNDPKTNASGQTLADANLLKIRITYGIPEAKQIPWVGKFINWALGVLDPGDPNSAAKPDADAFRAGLVKAGRIPVVTHIVMRMQSAAIENNNASSPGPGNEGVPKDPNPTPDPGPGNDDDDPPEECDPNTDLNGCLPFGCTQGDLSCDPGCGKNYCCLLEKGRVNADGSPANSSSGSTGLPSSNARP